MDILRNNTNTDEQQRLLKTNLTQISARLENTLNKLKAPNLDTRINLVDCNEWMDRLENQYRTNSKINFSRDIESNIPVPIDLFDSVSDNLLNNALRKESAHSIDIRLLSSNEIILLSICDDGDAIKPEIESDIFNQPVSSGSGMGIGLYQSSIMASAFNFELELSQNETGEGLF